MIVESPVEANARQPRAPYLPFLDTLQDSYFEADEQGYISYVNQAFCDNIGYSKKSDIIGQHFRHFTDRNFVRIIFQKFKQVYETKNPVEPFRYNYRTREGVTHIAEISVSPIMEGDIVVGTRGLLRDITDRVAAEETLQKTKKEVETQAEELAAINRIAVIVNQSLKLNEILQALSVELTKIFAVRNAGIGLITSDRKSLELVAFHAVDPDEKSALGMVLPFEGNPSAQEVVDTKRIVVIQDAQTDPRTQAMADVYVRRGTKAIMIVPLLARGNAIGTIGMPAKEPEHVFSDNEIRLAETIASQIAFAIDNARLHAQTEFALDVAERDLEIGRQIQAGFFPDKLPELPDWEISAHFEAARQVAGDFYDVFQIKDTNLIAVVIADVCDKGVGAALFMVLFRSLLRAFSNNQSHVTDVQAHLNNIISNTNNFIAEIHGHSNMFATIFLGILDPENETLYYVNGGHEAPAIVNSAGEIRLQLTPTGPAVGMFPDMNFRVEKVLFDRGDFLFGFTDGVTDAKDNTGKGFSEERLLDIIQAPWTSVFSLHFELQTEIQKHIAGQSQFDDITFISIRRKSRPESNLHAICRIAEMNILKDLRDFAEAAALQSGLTQEVAFAFKLAADEACTNIIQHGFGGEEPGLISLFFETEPQKARLTIRDNGTYFSPDQAADPDLTAEWMDRSIGGLGIFLIQELMDNVVYNKSEDSLNTLILEKNLTT